MISGDDLVQPLCSEQSNGSTTLLCQCSLWVQDLMQMSQFILYFHCFSLFPYSLYHQILVDIIQDVKFPKFHSLFGSHETEAKCSTFLNHFALISQSWNSLQKVQGSQEPSLLCCFLLQKRNNNAGYWTEQNTAI